MVFQMSLFLHLSFYTKRKLKNVLKLTVSFGNKILILIYVVANILL